ncbi:Ovarian-specific serine/threonine-protein kinase [Lachnellula occidentalis]|uniref:Autophagy-related protein 1 n=1 Tax=Lachnellula occidentalis TaxID=215460 RepID=A0A8H8RWC6_9HELO|nr:Ovarian-specific serine/threonine-protein kinase [Lachnellula occidentalis]
MSYKRLGGGHTGQSSKLSIFLRTEVSHDHIVAFVDILDGPDSILMLEYMAGGNFLQLVSPTEDEVNTTLTQQLLAVSYLHGMGITHRDIKPANILIQQRRPDLIMKLSDFGLSSETARLETFCGTQMYYAPETEESYRRNIQLQGTNESYTNAVDVVAWHFWYGIHHWFTQKT